MEVALKHADEVANAGWQDPTVPILLSTTSVDSVDTTAPLLFLLELGRGKVWFRLSATAAAVGGCSMAAPMLGALSRFKPLLCWLLPQSNTVVCVLRRATTVGASCGGYLALAASVTMSSKLNSRMRPPPPPQLFFAFALLLFAAKAAVMGKSLT